MSDPKVEPLSEAEIKHAEAMLHIGAWHNFAVVYGARLLATLDQSKADAEDSQRKCAEMFDEAVNSGHRDIQTIKSLRSTIEAQGDQNEEQAREIEGLKRSLVDTVAKVHSDMITYLRKAEEENTRKDEEIARLVKSRYDLGEEWAAHTARKYQTLRTLRDAIVLCGSDGGCLGTKFLPIAEAAIGEVKG